MFISKKTTLVVPLVLFGIAAGAQERLEVRSNPDGNTLYEIPLGDFRKMTLGDDGLVIHDTKGGSESFGYERVMSVRLSGFTSGITLPERPDSRTGLYYRDGHVGAGTPVTNAHAAVYDAGGRMLLLREQWDGSPISVAHLQKGAYIFQVNNKTIKFIRP